MLNREQKLLLRLWCALTEPAGVKEIIDPDPAALDRRMASAASLPFSTKPAGSRLSEQQVRDHHRLQSQWRKDQLASDPPTKSVEIRVIVAWARGSVPVRELRAFLEKLGAIDEDGSVLLDEGDYR